VKGPVVATLLVLAAPAAALADETIYAGPPSQYFTPSVSPDQGEPVKLTNVDFVDHDVIATDKGPDGKPLFRSELTARGGSVPVTGTEFLKTGAYGFFCSLHANMKGTINVTGAGQPKPRPGEPAQPPPPSSPPPSSPPPPSGGNPGSSDNAAPALRVRLVDGRTGPARKRKALKVAVTSDEAATVGLIIRQGKRDIASTTTQIESGTTTVSVRLRRALSRARRLKLTVVATAADAAGNSAKASSNRTLRR